MFIEKSKQAISVIDAHTGERDYLKVDKDATGFTIKIPEGKTKLKITKWYGVGQELTQEFDVVGSGSEKGVSGMTQISTGNAFAEDYCEAYSGYGATSLGGNCTPKIVGAVDGVVVYRTPCQKEFFEFELGANQKIELFVEDVVLIEKTYSATLKQNLSVKETLGLKAFEDYFGTGVILNELHEADRVFFADGLPVSVAIDGLITINKGYDESIMSTYGMAFIDCAYTKNEESKYVATKRRMYFYFVDDKNIIANYEYAYNNFIPKKDIYFLFQFGKVWMQTIFGFERTEVKNERLWLYRENNEEDLTNYETASLKFLEKCSSFVTPEKIVTIYNGYNSADEGTFFPSFVSVWASSLSPSVNTPKSNKSLKRQLKFLKEIFGLGVTPTIVTPLKKRIDTYGDGTIIVDWNSAEVMLYLKSKGYNFAYASIYALSKVSTNTLGSLNKNYLPDASIYGGMNTYTSDGDVSYSFDNITKVFTYNRTAITYPPANDIMRMLSIVDDCLGGVKKFVCNGSSWSLELTKSTIDFKYHFFQNGKEREDIDLFVLFAQRIVIGGENIKVSLSYPYDYSGASVITNNVINPIYAWLSEFMSISFIKIFLLACTNLGAVFSATNNSPYFNSGNVIGDTPHLENIYSIMNSKNFIMDSLRIFLQKDSQIFYVYGITNYSGMDISRTWTTYSDGVFHIREYIGGRTTSYSETLTEIFYVEPIPIVLKTFLEEKVIPELNKVYASLKSATVYVGGYINDTFNLNMPENKIETIMRDAFNQYISCETWSYRLRLSVNTSFSYDGATHNISNGYAYVDITDLRSIPTLNVMPASITINLNVVSNISLDSIDGNIAPMSVIEPEESDNKVVINVSDSKKVRTIVYTSPITIESISVNGQRIDAINKLLEDGTTRKFSVGNSTVTWKDSTITIYNFGTTTSLSVGDATFVI